MSTPVTSTPTEALVRVEAERNGRGTLLTDLAGNVPWSPRALPAVGGEARLALVQSSAMLLAGDRVGLELELGPGAHLTVIETGGTLAQDARGGAPASLRIACRLGAGACLRWAAQPLVLAAGCDLRRSASFELAASARALLRETIVLGRSGEQPGSFDGHTRVVLDGAPLLDERLRTDDEATLRSPLVAGDAKVLDSIILCGTRGEHCPGSSALAGVGSSWRACAPGAAAADKAAAPVWSAWEAALGGVAQAGG